MNGRDGAYFFGVYHWQRRARTAALAFVALAAAHVLWWYRRSRASRLFALVLVAFGLQRGAGVVRHLLRSPPWAVEHEIYEALADRLPYGDAERILDVGCGTGRSLVGLAPAIPAASDVLALDVFDSRVILGNAPHLARWNAARAGLDVTPVRGDAARLPVADGSQDVVTACRVLHDLPVEDARGALREARRVLGPDGTLGVLELPITHEDRAQPVEYWREFVADAGFEVETVDRIPRRGGESYCLVIVATP